MLQASSATKLQPHPDTSPCLPPAIELYAALRRTLQDTTGHLQGTRAILGFQEQHPSLMILLAFVQSNTEVIPVWVMPMETCRHEKDVLARGS